MGCRASQRPVRDSRTLPSSDGTLSELRFRITFCDRKVEVAVAVEVSGADKNKRLLSLLFLGNDWHFAERLVVRCEYLD